MSRGNALAQNRRYSLPCTVWTFRQWVCNQSVGCMQQLGSRDLGPSNRLTLGCYQPSPEVRLVCKSLCNLTVKDCQCFHIQNKKKTFDCLRVHLSIHYCVCVWGGVAISQITPLPPKIPLFWIQQYFFLITKIQISYSYKQYLTLCVGWSVKCLGIRYNHRRSKVSNFSMTAITGKWHV